MAVVTSFLPSPSSPSSTSFVPPSLTLPCCLVEHDRKVSHEDDDCTFHPERGSNPRPQG